VQIAWVVLDSQCNEVKAKAHLIKPEGFRIADEAEKYHGITNEMVFKHGEYADSVYAEFLDDLRIVSQNKGVAIAHSIDHEDCVLYNNLSKSGMYVWDHIKKFCTLNPAILTRFCDGSFNRDRTFGMKLVEMHYLFTGCGDEKEALRSRAHDALADVRMCADIFRELLINRKLCVDDFNSDWQKTPKRPQSRRILLVPTTTISPFVTPDKQYKVREEV